ncbi:MAG: alkaline phosphatase family protein [Acidiferrobacterales bacterium]
MRTVNRFSACLILLIGAAWATRDAAPAQSTSVERRAQSAIVISIDGLRPDAIGPTHAPTLHDLVQRGTYCPVAQTVWPSNTLPAHTSMFTGLDVPKHGVLWKHYRPGYYNGETVFSVAKGAGFKTAMFYAKQKLNYLARPGTLDLVYGAQPSATFHPDLSAAGVARQFERIWMQQHYDLVFIHIREPDRVGHLWGWMSGPYLRAVTVADQAVREIVVTLKRARTWGKTLLVVTADHGGSGRQHSTQGRHEDRTIPWIAVGPGVPASKTLNRPVYIYDTAPTVLAFLGLRLGSDVDGRTIEEVLGADGSISLSK